MEIAAKRLAESCNCALSLSTDSRFVFYFNMCSLSNYFPSLQQYVTCPMRSTHTLDCCYGNVYNAYKTFCQQPLGQSDHNVIHLLPKYRSKLKQQAVVTKDIQVSTNNSVEQLQDRFDDTDWDLFFNTGNNRNEITDTISAYIQFCEKNVIRAKMVRIFPNNKTWVSEDLKRCLNDKKRAFCNGDFIIFRKCKRVVRDKLR